LPLPDDLRALLSWHNGQDPKYPGSLEESWALMGTPEIPAAKRELDASPDTAKIGWQRPWIPFLDDNAGDYRCLDTSRAGPPVREFILGRTQHPMIAPSLLSWLEAFVTAAERGEYAEDPERGVFLRRHP
jgi:cell wall assembly regulator SMI1